MLHNSYLMLCTTCYGRRAGKIVDRRPTKDEEIVEVEMDHVVEVDEQAHACFMRICFCEDDLSLQESYGGLWEGEILHAEVPIGAGQSDDDGGPKLVDIQTFDTTERGDAPPKDEKNF